LTELEQELGKLKEEMRAMRPKAEPLAPLVADVTGFPPPVASKPSSESSTPAPAQPSPVEVSPPKRRKHFSRSVKKGRLHCSDGQTDAMYVIPDGIIAHLTRECGGNVNDCHIVDITSGSFEKETQGANRHSGAYHNNPWCAAQNAADLETDSFFESAFRGRDENIPHTRNNWICYDFKEKRVIPTHYAIRTHSWYPGGCHLKSWLVETSEDGESWQEVARQEDKWEIQGEYFLRTFPVASCGECRFIRLVNIGRNQSDNDILCISAWEIFGSLIQ
jgi:hypothetical protein